MSKRARVFVPRAVHEPPPLDDWTTNPRGAGRSRINATDEGPDPVGAVRATCRDRGPGTVLAPAAPSDSLRPGHPHRRWLHGHLNCGFFSERPRVVKHEVAREPKPHTHSFSSGVRPHDDRPDAPGGLPAQNGLRHRHGGRSARSCYSATNWGLSRRSPGRPDHHESDSPNNRDEPNAMSENGSRLRPQRDKSNMTRPPRLSR